MYLITMLGNLLIILAVTSDPHLHTPMYFFLSILSLDDICFTSTTVPKMLVNIQSHRRTISYVGCLTQMSLFFLFGNMDDMLLTVMAYDRYVAICHPLHYTVIMNPGLCVLSVWTSFLSSFVESQLHNLITLYFTTFKGMDISNFFCEPSQVLNLACSDNLTKTVVMNFVSAISGFLPVSAITFSYYKIISSILRIPSSGGKYKAFSTCGSHLTIVCLFYGTAIGVYLGSLVSNSPQDSAMTSLMYAVVVPMANPFIYSLRNKDLHKALGYLLGRFHINVLHCDGSRRGPNKTEADNLTPVSEFHVLCFSGNPHLQPVLCGLFLSLYLITVLGNLPEPAVIPRHSEAGQGAQVSRDTLEGSEGALVELEPEVSPNEVGDMGMARTTTHPLSSSVGHRKEKLGLAGSVLLAPETVM
ncbi:olfactory receptor 7E178-like [Thomomys bottae]